MSGPTPRHWEMEELVELARGALVGGRGARSEVVAPPAPLLAVGAAHLVPWEEQLASHHLPDRAIVVDLWRRCLEQPGVCLDAVVRRRFADTWAETEVRYLNLLHQADVACVLIISRPVREVEPPTDGPDGAWAVYEAPHVMVQHLDELGTILRSEGAVDAIYGLTAEELDGQAITDHIHPADLSTAIGMWLEIVAEPDCTRTIQVRFRRADGATVWVLSTVLNRLHDDGVVLTVTHDITDARDREAALRANEQELRFLTEEVPVAVFRTDAHLRITFANSRHDELLPGARGVDDLTLRIHPDDRAVFEAGCHAALVAGDTVLAEVRTVEEERVLAFRLRGVGDPHDRTPAGLIGTVEDVTVAAQATAALRHHAERDPLTGLANRRTVTQVLADAVSAGRSPVVLFGDLDDFKAVNDERGHDAGDTLLHALGERMIQAVRPDDVVGRWGGDEFVVVCCDVAPGGEVDLRDRLHAAFDAPIELEEWKYEPSMSLGAVRARPGETAEDVLKRADSAMYDAKRRRHRR